MRSLIDTLCTVEFIFDSNLIMVNYYSLNL